MTWLLIKRFFQSFLVATVGTIFLMLIGIKDEIYHFVWSCAVGGGFGWLITHEMDELRNNKKDKD